MTTGAFSNVLHDQLEKRLAFLICAYFIGHLIFFAGSYLDEHAYEPLRERLLLPDSGAEVPGYAAALHRFFQKMFPKVEINQKAYLCAEAVCDAFFGENKNESVKVLQWARSVLLVVCPDAAEEVRRLEADSKFFRSLIVVCLLAVSDFLWSGSIAASGVALLFSALCFIRYFERRLKAMTQACIHVITLRHLNKLPEPDSAA